MSGPRVTVLMSVHNGERFLREAIRSILSQTFRNFEFLIINDASTDGTPGILKEFDDPRIRVIENEINIGLTKSLNKGIGDARGEYIARMDADDISLDYRLEKQISLLDKSPEIGVVGGAALAIDKEGRVIETFTMPQHDREIAWDLIFYSPLIHPTVVIRRDILRRYGGYDTSRSCAQDYELWCRLRNATRFYNFTEPLILLRKHPDNITSQRTAEQAAAALQISADVLRTVTRMDSTPEDVHNLRVGHAETCDAAIRAAALLYETYRGLKREERWRVSEDDTLSRDATKRIMIMLRPYVMNPRTWPLLARAFWVAPATAVKMVFATLGRVVGGGFNGSGRDAAL